MNRHSEVKTVVSPPKIPKNGHNPNILQSSYFDIFKSTFCYEFFHILTSNNNKTYNDKNTQYDVCYKLGPKCHNPNVFFYIHILTCSSENYAVRASV